MRYTKLFSGLAAATGLLLSSAAHADDLSSCGLPESGDCNVDNGSAGCADEAQWTTDGRGGSFHPLGVAERLELFRTFLHGLPEDAAVLVVGHSGFWKKFLGQDQKMANCELVERAV